MCSRVVVVDMFISSLVDLGCSIFAPVIVAYGKCVVLIDVVHYGVVHFSVLSTTRMFDVDLFQIEFWKFLWPTWETSISEISINKG